MRFLCFYCTLLQINAVISLLVKAGIAFVTVFYVGSADLLLLLLLTLIIFAVYFSSQLRRHSGSCPLALSNLSTPVCVVVLRVVATSPSDAVRRASPTACSCRSGERNIKTNTLEGATNDDAEIRLAVCRRRPRWRLRVFPRSDGRRQTANDSGRQAGSTSQS